MGDKAVPPGAVPVTALLLHIPVPLVATVTVTAARTGKQHTITAHNTSNQLLVAAAVVADTNFRKNSNAIFCVVATNDQQTGKNIFRSLHKCPMLQK
jgi:hypothetical protein